MNEFNIDLIPIEKQKEFSVLFEKFKDKENEVDSMKLIDEQYEDMYLYNLYENCINFYNENLIKIQN